MGSQRLPFPTASDVAARAVLGGVLCALALAAPAVADTYCVAPATGCDHAVAPVPVVSGGTTVSDEKTIQSALNTAATHPGPDTIQLGAATYHIDDDLSNVSLVYPFTGEQATLRGMGPGQTILARNVLAQPPAAINGGALNVTDLTLHIPASGSSTLEADTPAIDTKGPLFRNLAIDVPGISSVGILIDNPLNETIDHVTFTGPANQIDSSTCIEANPSSPGFTQTITDVTATNCRIDIGHPRASAVIERAKINADLGVLAGGGAPSQLIENSVIHAFSAIEAFSGTTLVVNQSTLIGDGGGSGLFVTNSDMTSTADIRLFDTIVHGFGMSMQLRNSPNHAPVLVTTDYVTYAPIVQDTAGGITFTHTHDLGDPDPQFTAPGSDYTLKPSSPLIDQDPTALTIFEAPTDIAGNARRIDGKRDIGAYERPDPTAATDAATAVTQTAATLSGTANEGGAAGGGSAQLVYGTTTAYGQSLASQALPLSAAATAITGALTGLTPATTYHYALKVQTPLGTVTSADRTFTTAALGGGPNPPGAGGETPGGNTGNPKTTVAVIRSLSLSPSSFRAAKAGATLAAAKKRPVGGATLSVGLNVAATVTFTVTRQDIGVKSGKRCLARTRGRHGKPCTRPVRVGRATSKALKAGTTRLRFSGRVSSRALKAAKYVLTATPRGGKPRTVKFSIKR
jgi:hypothetical protein